MNVDKTLFNICATLIIIGIVFSLSLPVFTVLHFNYEHLHFFIRQLIAGVLGIFIMWALSRANPEKSLHTIGMILLFPTLVLMAIMHGLPDSLVTGAGGAKRWIRLPGFSFAPVEFFKIGFIYFLAWSFTRKIDGNKKSFSQEISILLPYLIVFAFVIYLIAVLQNDLGQVVVLGLVLIMMAMFAGTSFKLIGAGSLLVVTAVVIAIVTSPHRIERIKSWWSGVQDIVLSVFPASWSSTFKIPGTTAPYQISNSLNAINNGGFFGEGLGLGTFKLGFLSEVHTDFVLAGICEEIGLIGLFFIVCLVYVMLFRIFKISSRTTNKVYYLFTLGIGFMLFFSFLINAYGITSITPIKGLAVPFLSYGGSQLLASCIAVGLVLMISKRANI